MTIDFRDQQMFTAPLQSTTQRKTLTTQWQPYTIVATAPAAGPRPVFHTRLTLTPTAGSTVDVDSVSMTRQ